MEKTNGIKFITVLEKCIERTEKKITAKEFTEFLDKNIKIEKYIPLVVKQTLIDIFHIIHLDDEDDFSNSALNFEIYSIFGILFAYTNIEITTEEYIAENYDAVFESGLYTYIIKKCEDDYERTLAMFDRSITFKNGFIFNSLAQNLEMENLNESLETLNTMFKDLDDKKVSDISNILIANDKSLFELKDAVFKFDKEK